MSMNAKPAAAPEAPSVAENAELYVQQGNSKKERALRKVLLFFGVLILAYIYSDSLLAQQSAGQRVSVSQAVDFPNDI